MKKNKIKTILIVLITAILCLSVGAYAAYTLTATDVTYTKPDGTTVSVKEALDELRAKMETSSTVNATMTEAQSNDMLTKTKNSLVEDAYGNKIVVPAGFKITGDATTVDKGIVIIDSNQNEFVWIPTGTIYTNTQKTASETIELDRYTFDSSGNPTAQGGEGIRIYYQESSTSTYENTKAKNINEFIASAITNRGFYIGRYEARKNSSGVITEKGTDNVWYNIAQTNAAIQARNMYKDATTFTSDLINSYAWDTATLFLQTCGTNKTYSMQNQVSSSFASTGTNDTTKYTGTQDVQCNVYDIASNVFEWTTETYSSNSGGPCVRRGGGYSGSSSVNPSYRGYDSASFGRSHTGFRPLLYL